MLLEKEECGLWIIDMQETILSSVDRAEEILEKVCFFLQVAQILELPLIITEQYPKALGKTMHPIVERVSQDQIFFAKTTFSGMRDPIVAQEVKKKAVKNWILVGIETHICLAQTAKDLMHHGMHAVVLSDATSSRSLYDYAAALGDLRDSGARITSIESVIYELIKESQCRDFKNILPLIKKYGILQTD